ncbi:alpha/beta hydrolase [Paenibacillus thermotolerans]|uniref:alpha/beta hydrolase n=1 Tax=Paenibacillus thermotolerans TaxID=3027807 RepID=UPI002368B260|nr:MULTISPECIES: alpha/beta fold hydrolase [unclassified Paenibacillus]
MSRACLLIHGFTGGPYEVEPLAAHLALRGADCFTPTLAGHGGPLSELRGIPRQEWLASASAEAERIAERYGAFDCVGFSMGGLIAAYLANRYPVRKLVLLNAAVIYISPKRFLENAIEVIRNGHVEDMRIKSETPVKAVFEFMRLVRELKPEIGLVRAPTMIVQGDRDEIVHPKSAAYLDHHMNTEKELHIFPNSRHMICLGPEAKELFEKVERFLM